MLIEVSGLGDFFFLNIQQSVILELRIFFYHLKYSTSNDNFGKGAVNLLTPCLEASFSLILCRYFQPHDLPSFICFSETQVLIRLLYAT